MGRLIGLLSAQREPQRGRGDAEGRGHDHHVAPAEQDQNARDPDRLRRLIGGLLARVGIDPRRRNFRRFQQTRHGLPRCSVMAVSPSINGQGRQNVALASATASSSRPGPVLDERVVVVVAGVLAVVLGWLVTTYVGFTSGVGRAAVLTLSGLVCAWVIMSGPVPCLAAIAALAASGLDPGVAELGEFNATASDIFWVGLAGWWLLKVIDRAVRRVPSRPSVAFGQVPAIAFFAYAMLALLAEPARPGAVRFPASGHPHVPARIPRGQHDRDATRPASGAGRAGRRGRDRDPGRGLQRRDLRAPRPRESWGRTRWAWFRGSCSCWLCSAVGTRTWGIRWRRWRSSACADREVGRVLRRRGRDGGGRGRPRHPGATGTGAQQAGPRRAGDGPRGDRRLHPRSRCSGPSSSPAPRTSTTGPPPSASSSPPPGSRSSSATRSWASAGVKARPRSDRRPRDRDRGQAPIPRRPPDLLPDVKPASVHNTYIQILADLGMIGFSLFAA